MNVAMDGPRPSISDLMDEYHGDIGHDDKITWQFCQKRTLPVPLEPQDDGSSSDSDDDNALDP